jgi:hypothetical protein
MLQIKTQHRPREWHYEVGSRSCDRQRVHARLGGEPGGHLRLGPGTKCMDTVLVADLANLYLAARPAL